MLGAPCQRLAASLLGVSSFRSAITQPTLAAWSTQRAQDALCSSSSSNSTSSSSRCGSHRSYAAAGGDDYTAEVDIINEKFAEAREEIDFAREDAETVYFNESAEVARSAVAEVLERWQTLLGRVSSEEQAKLQRSMGLKIEQLKAELKELDELHA